MKRQLRELNYQRFQNKKSMATKCPKTNELCFNNGCSKTTAICTPTMVDSTIKDFTQNGSSPIIDFISEVKTAEEVLDNNLKGFENPSDVQILNRHEALKAMKEYAELQTKSLKERVRELEDSVGNLLAVFHADGGHYLEKHGLKKATEDAFQVYYNLKTEVDILHSRIKKLEEEKEVKSGYWIAKIITDVNEAHNKAIQQCIDRINKQWDSNLGYITDELEKLKL